MPSKKFIIMPDIIFDLPEISYNIIARKVNIVILFIMDLMI